MILRGVRDTNDTTKSYLGPFISITHKPLTAATWMLLPEDRAAATYMLLPEEMG